MAKRGAAGRGLTRFAERRSPDPAHWRCLDSHQVGDQRSIHQAIPRANAGKARAAVCDRLDTIVTRRKLLRPAGGSEKNFSYSHVYPLVLTYSQIKKYYFFFHRGLKPTAFPHFANDFPAQATLSDHTALTAPVSNRLVGFHRMEQTGAGEPLTIGNRHDLPERRGPRPAKRKMKQKISLLDLPLCVIIFQGVVGMVTLDKLKARMASTVSETHCAPVSGSYFSDRSLIRARTRTIASTRTQSPSLPQTNCRADKFFRIVNHVSRS